MGVAKPVKRFTPLEYYELERSAEYRSEFYQGEIFAMAGGSRRHSLIAMNIAGELRQRLKGKPCTPYDSNLRIKVMPTGYRAYPDVSVFCDPPLRDPEDPSGQTYTNPTVLFEVLSRSTEAFDRGFKWNNYQLIPSLRCYLLVAQSNARVEMFTLQPDGLWDKRMLEKLTDGVNIPALGLELPMTEIYDRIDFSAGDAD